MATMGSAVETASRVDRAEVELRADLALVLSDFAHTMLTDLSTCAILSGLVSQIVEVLDVRGAGVTVLSSGPAPDYVTGSDEVALRFERLQADLGQGPGVTAYQTGEMVWVEDLSVDIRYPDFGTTAVHAGLAAVFTFPLRHGDGRFGALNLYRDTPGSMTPEELTAAQTLADVAAGYLLIAQAREEVAQAAQPLQDSGLHDSLTGLPNRTLLQERLLHAGQRCQSSRSTAAVLFTDLDRFKRVNDSFGHAVGDDLLVAVATRLAGLLRPGDTLARVSGDEFVIFCEDLDRASEAEVLAERILQAFQEPFQLVDRAIAISASVGVAVAGPEEHLDYRLVVDADTAMYEVKRSGGAGHRVVDSDLAHEAQAQLSLEQDLREAVRGAGLSVAYQPMVRTEDGMVTGVEALLRWTHPLIGPVAALTAITVAEQSALINEVGAWVLERACRDHQRWSDAHREFSLDLSVNVSAHQLVSHGFIGLVTDILARTGMDPAALIVEVTEGTLIDDGPHALDVLVALRAHGVRVALDDFGTGYSSLNYLRRFPIDIVKIDQVFVADIGRDPAAEAIVSAINHLSRLLGMTVTAEGVETAEQHEQLKAMECEQAQGHLYAKPMTAQDLCGFLSSSKGFLPLPGTVSKPIDAAYG